MPKPSLPLLLFILLTSFTASAQSTSTFLNHVTNILQKQAPQEKVYLHLDRANYGVGDTIWYKAYTVIGSHHQLSGLSGVLYVELISPKDSLVTRQTLHLVSGVAWSDIPLLVSLKQGDYHIRAYTNWMRNTGPGNFYTQPIRLGGIPSTSATSKQITERPDVQFFPEGGRLVNGVRSRITIKAVNSKGLGEDIKGTIEDNEGNTVADFATQHLGMGVFAMVPQSGKTYKAKIFTSEETRFNIDLPKAEEEGYTLALNMSQKDSINIKISVNEKTFSTAKNSLFYLIAQSNGTVYYTSQGDLDGLVHTAKVDKARFPSGIAQFTLFGRNGEPVAERIVFIQNSDTLKLQTTLPTPAYLTRHPIAINLKAIDNYDQPVTGSFSVAVINESQAPVDLDSESSIFSNLLLTSDLKGYVEKPNYYFNNATEQKRADLDVLMLTQGYRRFDWKQIINDSVVKIPFYKPERSLAITGTLRTPLGKPLPNGKVTLVATQKDMIKDTTADLNGNFKFNDISVIDTVILVLKARKDNNGSNVKIEVQQPDYPNIMKTINNDGILNLSGPEQATMLQKKHDDYLAGQKKGLSKSSIQLNQVNIHGDKQPKAPPLTQSANLNGPGHANQVIMGNVIEGCINITECLTGKVFGVRFINGVAYNKRGIGPTGSVMTIIIDGVVLDGNSGALDNINASDIYSIEVLRSGSYLAIYGSEAPGGALVITTKRGGEGNKRASAKSSPGLLTYPFIGYYKARAFYSPKYTPKSSVQPNDMRPTIYWNPNILTDKDGKASIEYFNDDTKGVYRVVLEGIDDNGNLGRQVYRYKVE